MDFCSSGMEVKINLGGVWMAREAGVNGRKRENLEMGGKEAGEG